MKKLFMIFLIVLVSADLFAETKGEKLPMLNDINPDPVNLVVTEDVGEIIFNLDVESIVDDYQLVGVEYDGTHLWVTGGGSTADPNYLYRIDPVAGTLVDSYEQPAAATGWGIRDLAYIAVENKIYGGNETSFFSFDIATETWTTEFNSTFGTIRALAYDGNHFWTKNFSDPIYEFDVTGLLHSTYADANSAYGFAYDSFADCLWLFASTTTFVQFGLDGVPTGTTHAVTLPNDGLIGGAFYYEGGLVPNKTVLGCLGQGTSDVVYAMELRDIAPLALPGAPTGVTVTPDTGGALTADIDWTCPTLDVGGSTLTDLDEMRVYRDGVLIHTDTTSTIGEPGSYADAVPVSGNYAYSVVGFNDAGEGIPTTVANWVGEDVPNVVENLMLEQTSPGVLSGTLTWVNPITGLNGGAYHNPVLGYHIERSDGGLFELIGLITEYTDSTIPATGIYYYTVQPYNSIGYGGVSLSNSVLINNAGLLVMEDFTTWLPVGWTTEGGSNWMQGTGNLAGGTAPEAEFNWDPSTTATQRLISPVVNTTGATDLNLSFRQTIDDFNGYYTLYIQTTSDGVTWNNVMTIPSASVGPELVEEIIATLDVGSATFQVAWTFDGSSFNMNFWYVDDVMLTIGNACDYGYIEGNVTLDGGTGEIEDVEVTAFGVTVNPDDMGNYEINVAPGIYDVTAVLDGYDLEVIEDIVVTEGNVTTGVNFEMFTCSGEIIIVATKLGNNYPNPFNPVTNITYSIKETGNVTIEVYNMRGQLVKTLVNEVKETDDHTAVWNGTDNSNKSVSSGVYFYKMVSESNIGRYTSTKKMILMK